VPAPVPATPASLRFSRRRIEKAGIHGDGASRIPRMKNIRSALALAILALTFPPLNAEEGRVVPTPPSFGGTFREFGPEGFMVRPQTETEPATYLSTKETQYVDESGVPVSKEAVKSGAPVTVYFTKEGDQIVATKVVVHRGAPPRQVVAEEKRTGSDEESGTVGEFVTGELTVEVDDSRAPRKYNCNSATIYLNETGASVPADAIRAGVPVTVQFSNEGQRRIATKVIVHKDKPVRAERRTEKPAENLSKEDAEKLLKKEEERRKEKLEK